MKTRGQHQVHEPITSGEPFREEPFGNVVYPKYDPVNRRWYDPSLRPGNEKDEK